MRNGMPNYTKLFSTIVTSTIWAESDRTRIVWITMLALADKNGEVHASLPGLARLAGVPLEDCEKAVTAFLSPDQYSRTPDNEGRRIVKIDGGWELLNFRKYRELASTADTLNANARRQKRWRDRNADVTDSNGTVTPDTLKAEAKANSEANKEVPDSGLAAPQHTPSAKPKGEARAKKPNQTDEEWIVGIEAMQAYKSLNVRHELERAQLWCKNKNRQCTRIFFTNWLNRAVGNAQTIATVPKREFEPGGF